MEDPFERLVGILPSIDTDEVLRELRGPDFDPAAEGNGTPPVSRKGHA
jgi:hypothetical protein